MGKLLRVDLDTGRISEEKLEEKSLRMFIGGLGFGVKILYDEVPAGVGALDSENRLIFATGPLNGTAAPGSGTYCLVSKSPLTGFVASAQANGFFGARLKHAGYDAIVVQGASIRPVYLWVHDSEAEIRNAERLWGTTTFECENKIKEELKQPNASVACIGPAGENLVRVAAVFSDEGHVASSGGQGAVMGSKKLKAVAVYGTEKIPLADDEKFKEASKRLVDVNMNAFYGKLHDEQGTAGWFPMLSQTGALPLKNCTSNAYPPEVVEKFTGANIRKNFKIKRKPCWACPINHAQTVEVAEGPYKGLVSEEPEYEDFAGWGMNIGNFDPAAAIYLTRVNDGLGMDVKESAFLISMAIECYEDGVITKDFIDGLELKWGDVKAAEALLEKIAKRQGKIGNILAEGLKRASYLLGEPDRAVYLKGAGPHVLDFRGLIPSLFDQSVCDTASIQGSTASLAPDPEMASITTEVHIKGLPMPFLISRASKRHFVDCLVLCHFNVNLMTPPVTFEPYILDLVRAATGWEDFNLEEALTVSERIINLARVFNIKHGLTPDDDWPSPRMLEPPKDGPAKGVTLKPNYKGLLMAYYKVMGWDEKTGKPLKSTLKRLGLEYCAKDIYP
jgi:aldehyde:ferredoxin oxidoreductase